MHEDLTVRENLVYSARLRLAASKPLPEQRLLVEDVVDALQLRHVQHQVVGSAERRGIRWVRLPALLRGPVWAALPSPPVTCTRGSAVPPAAAASANA